MLISKKLQFGQISVSIHLKILKTMRRSTCCLAEASKVFLVETQQKITIMNVSFNESCLAWDLIMFLKKNSSCVVSNMFNCTKNRDSLINEQIFPL